MILDPIDYRGIDKIFEKGKNDYDYLEIGTCDWDVMSMTNPDLKGIIVEPIEYYLNNIPSNKNVIKQKCAISNENREDYMYYIHPDVIESKNIINCFRGMNRLSQYHMGHQSENLTNYVTKEKCEVLTYFTLLKKLNVNYIDFLKIDTEGHDCDIINNILNELPNNINYILPKYIYFENNGLCDITYRTDTIYRLIQYGYVHIFTENDNTFMYNCKNYFERTLQKNNISFPKDLHLNNKNDCHFLQNVHTYISLGQKSLFQNILKLNVTENAENANIIWTTQSKDDFKKYQVLNKKMVNIIHGGGYVESVITSIIKPNIMIKSIKEYIDYKDKCNLCFFISKYDGLFDNFTKIFDFRQNKQIEIFNNNNFFIQHGFFDCNHDAIKNTYRMLQPKYDIHLYGYDSNKFNSTYGWGDTITENMDLNILTKYKFNLHLKGCGYLCNSVLFAMMSGIPTIMSKQNYYETLYYQFIPKELIIFYDNYHAQLTTPSEIECVLKDVCNMSLNDYLLLCKKNYIHGTYFRKQYTDEIEHLYNFMNKL